MFSFQFRAVYTLFLLLIATVCYCDDSIESYEKKFVSKKNSKNIYYIENSIKYIVPGCRPCGLSWNLCDGSKEVLPITSLTLKSFDSSTDAFNCEKHGGSLWEGNMFITHRKAMRIKLDSTEKPRINILMCGIGRAFTGGPLSIMHFANELVGAGTNTATYILLSPIHFL